mmetsp:Transcript_7087/g.10323  ORF Transcript_7087/g.10323 Transcript_7087/m.10323 type:complete len:114 (+) Transcript_7087:73-414(+)
MKEEFGSIDDGGEVLCLWGVRFAKAGGRKLRSNVLKTVTRRNSSASSYTDSAKDDLCKFAAWLSSSITTPSIAERKHLKTHFWMMRLEKLLSAHGCCLGIAHYRDVMSETSKT